MMSSFLRQLQWLLLAGFIALTCAARADVRMPAIFGDHMVLQGSSKIPVWGWAAPGERVSIVFQDQKRTTYAAVDGTWRVELESAKAANEPQILIITGDNTIIYTDVLVGDVWIASGQSNMEFGIQTDSRGEEAIANATNSEIRLFFVPWAAALEPRNDLGPAVPPSPFNGKWLVCNPENMATNWAWHGFSAVGYYFASEIHRQTHKPVGMIGTYKGGTPAEAWTSISGLQKDPAFAQYVAAHEKLATNYTAAKIVYTKQQDDYRAAMRAWNARTNRAATAPRVPVAPDGGYTAPGNLFNGMVAPLIPYALKGVIWYQGESNANSPAQGAEYATLFPRMITDWREKWAQGNFPFLFVQLPNMNGATKVPSEGKWPWVRDSQLKTLALPNTGMAITIDVGEAENLHPPDKFYVGQRLALVARHVAYGKDLVYTGPIYDSMTITGNKVRLRFQNTGGGLKIGTPPPRANGLILPLAPELAGFAIAGTNQNFVWAKAVIEGDSVVAWSDDLSQPSAVRYDWAQNPPGNLYNEENLPASPFRTDNWPAK